MRKLKKIWLYENHFNLGTIEDFFSSEFDTLNSKQMTKTCQHFKYVSFELIDK